MKDTEILSRLPLVEPETASQPVAAAFGLLPVINIFRAMANAQTLFPPYMDYLSELFKHLELGKELERMIVLRVSARSACDYAWRQNIVVARSVGVSEAQIEALARSDSKADCFNEAEKSAFAFTDEVMEDIEASDATYLSLKHHFSDRAITEMLYVIGTYMFVARLVRSGRVPLDEQPAPSPQK